MKKYLILLLIMLIVLISGIYCGLSRKGQILKAVYIKDVGENFEEIYVKDLLTGDLKLLAKIDISKGNYYTHRYYGRECNVFLIADELFFYDTKTCSICCININSGEKKIIFTADKNGYFRSFKVSEDIKRLVATVHYDDPKYDHALGHDAVYLIDLVTQKKKRMDFGMGLIGVLPYAFVDDQYFIFEADIGTKGPRYYILSNLTNQEIIISMYEYVIPSKDQIIFTNFNGALGYPPIGMYYPTNSLRRYVFGEKSVIPVDFSNEEFNNEQALKKLCESISHDGPFVQYNISFKTPDNTIERLNELLQMSNLYDVWFWPNEKTTRLGELIEDLVVETYEYRSNAYVDLSIENRVKIKRLNRLLLEALYSKFCPKNVALDAAYNGFLIDEGYSYDISRLALSKDNKKIKFANNILKNDGERNEKWFVFCIEGNKIVPYDETMEKEFPPSRYALNSGASEIPDNSINGKVDVYDRLTNKQFLLDDNIESGYFLGIYSKNMK
ncbi:MAG: hypothetical protein ABIH69_04440 [bacterium]